MKKKIQQLQNMKINKEGYITYHKRRGEKQTQKEAQLELNMRRNSGDYK